MLRTNPPGGMRHAKKPRCLNSCHDIRSGKNGYQRVRPRRKPGQTRRKTFRQADSGTSKIPESLTRPRSRLNGNNQEQHGAKPSEQTPEKKRRRKPEKKRRETPGKQNKTRETADGFCASKKFFRASERSDCLSRREARTARECGRVVHRQNLCFKGFALI